MSDFEKGAKPQASESQTDNDDNAQDLVARLFRACLFLMAILFRAHGFRANLLVANLFVANNRFYSEIYQIALDFGFDATPIIHSFETNGITSATFALPGVAGYSDASEFIDDVNPRCNLQNLRVVWRALQRKYLISGAVELVSRQGRTMVHIVEHLLQDIIDRRLLEEDMFDTTTRLNQHLQETIRLADDAVLMGYRCFVHTLEPSHGRRFVLINSGLHHRRTSEALYMLCVPNDVAITNCVWQLVRLVTARDIELFAPCYSRGQSLPPAIHEPTPGTSDEDIEEEGGDDEEGDGWYS